MIVMRDMIPDKVAHQFLKYFLQSFSAGNSFYLATREARERLKGLEDRLPCASWLPVIFQNPAETPPTWESLIDSEPLELTNSKPKFVKRTKFIFISVVGIFGLLITTFTASIGLSHVFQEKGIVKYDADKKNAAKNYLRISLFFNPKNDASRSVMGNIYEDFQNYNQAKKQYRIASFQGGNLSACNNLARLYITQDKEYRKAENYLYATCLHSAEKNSLGHLYILKTLGLSLWKQGKYQQAEDKLRQAMHIDREHVKAHNAGVYCLLAKVLQEGGDTSLETTRLWHLCQEYTDPDIPEERKWRQQAREILAREESNDKL
jgi:tetratricopeptide (TPR) repeat protein